MVATLLVSLDADFPTAETQVQSELVFHEILTLGQAVLCVFGLSLLIIIQPLAQTHLSEPTEVYQTALNRQYIIILGI
jgi:hypothetical protein